MRTGLSEFFVLVVGVTGVWIMILAVIGFTARDVTDLRRYPLIVLFACLLHFIWAGCLLVDPAAGDATSLAGLSRLLPPFELAILLFVVASLSLIYVFFGTVGRLPTPLFALPQQAVLFISAWSALNAMLSGQFADGVARPSAFIIADQSPAILAALLHATAIVLGYWKSQFLSARPT